MRQRCFSICLGVFVAALAAALHSSATAATDDGEIQSTLKKYVDGNYAEALDELKAWLMDTEARNPKLAEAYRASIDCLQRLNRTAEIDAHRHQIAEAHPKSWRLLFEIANSYLDVVHHGHLIAGEFERGQHRGGGHVVNAWDRDRVAALRLYLEAWRQVHGTDNAQAAANYLQRFAYALRHADQYGDAWRLQMLTNLADLPDYQPGWGHHGGQPRGAPVDEDGDPVYYELPATWEAARNDGERWRWVLGQLARLSENHALRALDIRATFLREQFGVHTLAQYGWILPREQSADDTDLWAIHTLGDDETIARLATGVKRFKLPEDHNFIKLHQQAIERWRERKEPGVPFSSVDTLARIFQDRHQYPRAADMWRLAVEHSRGRAQSNYQQQLAQIVDAWGQFEPVMTQPAGRGATVEFRFRNADAVEFTAHEIDVQKLLDDVKKFLKARPQQLDWQQLQIDNLGYRLVHEKQEKYIGKEVARWELALEPRDNHFDRRTTVTTPLQKAGAYLVTAKVANGNTSNIVLWLADTAILRKPLPQKSLYFVADAVTGKPIANANVEFFGYWNQHVDGRKFRMHLEQFAELTDENGQTTLPVPEDNAQRNMQWLVTATTPQGRLAYLGFAGVWHAHYHDQQYHATRVFTITDRPVYRPKQNVEFKFWVRQAKYDQGDTSEFAHKSFQVVVRDPKNEEVFNETFTADQYGGIAGTYEIPGDATLGQYQLQVVNHGGGTFRVEEYKKPEFEVTIDAPSEPVELGDTIKATIRANYYFGSPVTHAQVKYKVYRTPHTSEWYPPSRWDWLYGPGHWWFSYDYDWYPGWQRWGCLAPTPWWFWRAPSPPELVAEAEAEIGHDGTVEVEIDTSIAKALHSDQDHSYEIQAEVVDQSRRTIVGNGRVLVARQPFKVFTWLDRGHYRVGDTVLANFAARRLDGKPVTGTGTVQLLKLDYPNGLDGAPEETEVRRWDLPTNRQGRAELQINASEAGQYRIAYEVTDQANHTIEGGYVFTIAGEGFDGSQFRFNALELIPDKRAYAPGDQVQLQLNTNRTDSTVLLFLRPAGGAYLSPQVVRLAGKSVIVPIDVVQKDMPNSYVEAVTIADGRLHTVTREIHVPPAERALGVEVVPSAESYQPGQEAVVQLKLTDHDGKPYVGSTVVAVYDKSVEYIAGGSNVDDIRAFFWKWRRAHRTQSQCSLDRQTANLVPRGQLAMQPLGVFGSGVANLDLVTSTVGGGFGARVRRAELRSQSTAEFFGQAAPTAARALADEAAHADAAATEPALAPTTVRTEFADTALWVAALETNTNGIASANLTMPENLTTWKVRVWGMGHGTRVGEGSAEVVTRKNLIVRMQAPRFFVETDEVVLSANVHNYLSSPKQVQVRLELGGDTLEAPSVTEETIEIAANEEARVDWRVRVRRDGEAVVRMLALTDEESDAVQQNFPVLVHGMLKTESYSGALRPDDDRGAFEVAVPAQRRAADTRLEIRYSPTLAGAMVDALPYLIDYPYGCTEQTLNRFLPAVITQQTLLRMGIDLAEIEKKRTNLDAQEVGDDATRAQQWQRFDTNPVFDAAELDKVVKAGVKRLTDMQLSDGGWGWFSGHGERSTPHTTAVVVHGLQVARQNDVALVPGVLNRGVDWLKAYQAEQLRRLNNCRENGEVIDEKRPHKQYADNLDALVHMVLTDADAVDDAMRTHLYNDRTHLAVYGLAMLGISLHNQHQADQLAMVMRNLSQYLVEDDENQTAYLNLPAGQWWYWYGSEFEAHAYYLKLLAANEPRGDLAPRLVKFLLNNRKHATYWNSTRDTALVVEALAAYLETSGEANPDLTVEVWLDGKKRKEVAINADNLFSFDNRFVITGEDLEPGRHTVELRKRGTGPLYYNGYLTNFTTEEDIRRAGLELKVNRRYYQLIPSDATAAVAGARGQTLDQRLEKYNRQPVTNFGQLTSGDLVEIELVVESKNDYEYVILEDMKAAGFEPVALRSGYNGNELGAYMELRDSRVNLFVRRLARGTHSVSYRMRAEIPGRFSALPTKAYAMYAPELRANSDEIKVRVED